MLFHCIHLKIFVLLAPYKEIGLGVLKLIINLKCLNYFLKN